MFKMPKFEDVKKMSEVDFKALYKDLAYQEEGYREERLDDPKERKHNLDMAAKISRLKDRMDEWDYFKSSLPKGANPEHYNSNGRLNKKGKEAMSGDYAALCNIIMNK